MALLAADAWSPSLEGDKGGNKAEKQCEGGIERYTEIKRDAEGEVEV